MVCQWHTAALTRPPRKKYLRRWHAWIFAHEELLLWGTSMCFVAQANWLIKLPKIYSSRSWRECHRSRAPRLLLVLPIASELPSNVFLQNQWLQKALSRFQLCCIQSRQKVCHVEAWRPLCPSIPFDSWDPRLWSNEYRVEATDCASKFFSTNSYQLVETLACVSRSLSWSWSQTLCTLQSQIVVSQSLAQRVCCSNKGCAHVVSTPLLVTWIQYLPSSCCET